MHHYCIMVKYKRTNKKVDELKINIKCLKYNVIYILGDSFIEEHLLLQKRLPLQKIFLLNHINSLGTKQRRYFLEYFDT